MNTFYLIALIIFLSVTVVLSISDVFKLKRRYMLIIRDNIKYFSTFLELKKYLSDKANALCDFKIYVRDDKEYEFLTDYLELE